MMMSTKRVENMSKLSEEISEEVDDDDESADG